MPVHLPACRGALLFAAVVSVVMSVTPIAQQANPTMPVVSSPGLVVDVVVTDQGGAPVDNLGADDFVVTVDGARRNVASVRYVTRGPGALHDAQSLQALRPAPGGVAAEPARTVIVVIDQTTLARGDEKATTAAVRRVVDRLGLDDRVGLVRLPLTGRESLELSNDRPALVASLRQIMGQAVVAGLAPPVGPFAVGDTGQPVIRNPDRAGSESTVTTVQERPAVGDDRVIGRDESDGRQVRGNLPDLRAVFTALGNLPGRKVVVLFSGGLTAPRADSRMGDRESERIVRSLVDEVSLDATRAHAVVEAFGLRSIRIEGVRPDVVALEMLTRATGGQFAAMGRNVDQIVGRVVSGASACYVLGLDGGPHTGEHQALRVTTPRPGIVVRAPAWLVARPDVADRFPPAAVAASIPAAAPSLLQPGQAAPVMGPAPKAPSAELRRLLARVAGYVETYQREYSTVVAEEDFEQLDRTPGASPRLLRLTSDLLLVRVDWMAGWVSFRDIYAVNGQPLREREQRLQRLFLDPSAEGRAKLEDIQFESSKYNIGPVERTTNAPLFSLMFLEEAYQSRFAFSLGNMREVDGLAVTALEYRETSSPTIVRTKSYTDQPVGGRFLVDPVSGAVVASQTIYARKDAGQVEHEVRYRRDDKLGLWLPFEMKETYSIKGTVMTHGVARYKNFRRFQVTTETRVKDSR